MFPAVTLFPQTEGTEVGDQPILAIPSMSLRIIDSGYCRDICLQDPLHSHRPREPNPAITSSLPFPYVSAWVIDPGLSPVILSQVPLHCHIPLLPKSTKASCSPSLFMSHPIMFSGLSPVRRAQASFQHHKPLLPNEVKAIARAKIKTDKRDSEVLAHKLRMDMIPEGYRRPPENRRAQRILRQRAFLCAGDVGGEDIRPLPILRTALGLHAAPSSPILGEGGDSSVFHPVDGFDGLRVVSFFDKVESAPRMIEFKIRSQVLALGIQAGPLLPGDSEQSKPDIDFLPEPAVARDACKRGCFCVQIGAPLLGSLVQNQEFPPGFGDDRPVESRCPPLILPAKAESIHREFT